MKHLAWIWALAAALVACDTAPERPPLATPPFAVGKADVGDHVATRGALAFGDEAATTSAFTEDLEFHGYTLTVRAGASVGVEVSHKGSAGKLDSTLYVFGPRNASGGYGSAAIAFDDDAGWGRLSRLRPLALTEGGTYLVVVGTRDGRGRGAYRLVATCQTGVCEPLPVAPAEACHPAIAEAITACADDWMADPDLDPSVTSRLDLLSSCADPEVTAPAFDALCAEAGAPSALCELDMESFATTHLPVCARELVAAHLDETCVFGDTWRDALTSEAMVVVSRRDLRVGDPMTPLEREQVVAAVHTTSHDHVTTAEEALAAADEGVVHQVELWDASGRRAFTAYELGAGDNSYGAIFDHGATTAAARIHDGDLLGCEAHWGPERRRCDADDACAVGLTCVGRPEGGLFGRCVDLAADQGDAAVGAACVGADGCPAGVGLVCGGAETHPGGEGLCLPAWMRGRHLSHPDVVVPGGASSGVEAQLLVSGLATACVEATLDLVVDHPRLSDLRVWLVSPGGTEVLIYDGTWSAPEIYLDGEPVHGLPGDEAANGVWRLRVVDTGDGEDGYIYRFGLTVTSRWD